MVIVESRGARNYDLRYKRFFLLNFGDPRLVNFDQIDVEVRETLRCSLHFTLVKVGLRVSHRSLTNAELLGHRYTFVTGIPFLLMLRGLVDRLRGHKYRVPGFTHLRHQLVKLALRGVCVSIRLHTMSLWGDP